MKVLKLLLCLVLLNYAVASEFESLAIDSTHSIINEDIQKDDFGSSISSYGSTLAVGAPLRTRFGVMSGSVYIFEKEENHSWRFVEKLDDRDALNLGSFVQLHGDWLAATGQSFKFGSSAVYIFHKVEDHWELWQVLSETNPDPKNFFGCDVKIQNNLMVIGAYGENDNAGAAYFYELIDNKWEMIQRVAPEVVPESYFGNYVALDGDVAIISSWGTTVNDMAKAGSAHVYKRTENGEWNKTHTLISPEGYYFQKFGSKCLALRDNMAMVCASTSDIDNITEAGAVFTFSYEKGSWVASQRLSPCDPFCFENYHFGSTLGLSKDLVIIGSDLKNHDRRDMFVYKKNSVGDWERLYHFSTSDISKGEGFLHVSLDESGLVAVGTVNKQARGSVNTLYLRCVGREGKNCNLPCRKHCVHGLCEGGLIGSGNCICNEGFTGELCDIPVVVDHEEEKEETQEMERLTDEETEEMKEQIEEIKEEKPEERPEEMEETGEQREIVIINEVVEKQPEEPKKEIKKEPIRETKKEPKKQPAKESKVEKKPIITKSHAPQINKTKNEEIKPIVETEPHHDEQLTNNHTDDQLQTSEHKKDVEITDVRITSIALVLVFVAIMIGIFLAIYIKRDLIFSKVEPDLPSFKSEGEIVFNEDQTRV